MDLNKAQIIGRVTNDLKLDTFLDDKVAVNFSVATNRTWKDKDGIKNEEAEFSNIVMYWPKAELAIQLLKKWSHIYIEWRLRTRTWEWEDGKKRYKTEIIANEFILLDKLSNVPNYIDQEELNKINDKKTDKKNNKDKKEEEVSIEDIPF